MAKKSSRSNLVPNPTPLWLVGLMILAAAFRVLRLGSLPPGLSGGEAAIGLSALSFIHHGIWPGWSTGDSFAPLWTLLQALAVWLFGHTATALRIWPAIIGLASVGAVWLWARDWFGTRVAWVAAVLIAVTPWSVTLARSGSPAVSATLLVPLTLLLGGRAVTRGRWWWGLGLIIVVDLTSGPLGWTTVLAALVLGIVAVRPYRSIITNRSSWGGLALAAVGVVAAGIAGAIKWHQLRQLFTAGHATAHVSTITSTLSKVAAMFNLQGDPTFLHNFNAEPMFNAFVGLMFVAGLLFAGTKASRSRYLALLIAFVVLLLPALVSPLGAPNDAHAAAALPVAVVLAAVGIGYMLDLWHATFPINSAARSTGLAAILFLLGLTVFQGYVQVFRAWSGSAETYLAYDEAAVAAAHYLKAPSKAATRVLVATPDEQTVVAYLDYGQSYVPITAAGVGNLTTGKSHQFVISASVRDETARNLALKFPGGKLAPHLSTFSQNELFYDYETSQ